MKSFYKFLLRSQTHATAPENPDTPAPGQPSQSATPVKPGPDAIPAVDPDHLLLTTFSFAVQKVYPFIINITVTPPGVSTPSNSLPPATKPAPVADGKSVSPAAAKSLPLIRSNFTLEKYVSLVLLLSLAFGLSFQMPLAVFLLGRLKLIDLPTLRKIRKFVLFGIVIFSAMITPPDVLSQILMAIPMYLLYELGIIMLVLWPSQPKPVDPS